MKKFLSILLAVMMVLSTASFAAPAAITAVDSDSYVAVEETATAEFAAEAGDKSSYGILIYSIDFERDDFNVDAFSTDYAKLADNPTAAYMNEDFPFDNVTTYTNAAGTGFKNAKLVTEGDNTYITGDVAASYDGFFRMTKYNTPETAWPDGYYTFSVDVKAPEGQVESFAQQCNDTKIALTTLAAFDVNSGDWQTVVNQTTNVTSGNSEAGGIYGFFVTPNNATAGTVAYDNWEVYYRPATVTLTIAGTEYEVSTDAPVSAASLASKVAAPTGYILSGLSLTDGGELLEGERYFFEDTTLYPTFVKDPYMSDVYGKALFVIDFESDGAKNWWGHSSGDNSSCSYGAWISDVASYYDERFANGVNYRARFIINEGTHIDQATVADGDNHYTTAVSVTKWPQIALSNWASVQGEPGVYTFVVDTMTDTVPSGFANNAAWTAVDGFGGAINVWDRIVLQQEMAAAGNLVSGEPIINYSFAEVGAKISFDNASLYFKPLTADVTLIYNGEEYVAEDVSTAGVSSATVLTAAGLDIPYGKKAVLSATYGGESVGNVINLVSDSTYYVTFVDDDSISEYGKRLFLIDFENLADGELPDQKAISTYTDDFDGDWSHLTINWEVGDAKGTVSEEDDNKIVKGTQNWAQIRISDSKVESAPAGYYTMEYKTKNYGYGTEAKTIAAKDQASQTEGKFVDPFVDNGEWDTVAAEWDYAAADYTLYYTAQMSTDVAFDDIALYFRPATINLTIDNNGVETVYKDVDSSVNVDDLLADVAVPFGKRVGLAVEKNGKPLTGSINLVSDAKLYVVYADDDRVNLEYGEALVIIDFERADMQGWNGNAQEIDNSVKASGAYVYQSASYYDPMFEGKNFRVRFVINEGDDWLFDQKTVEDENGNHYTTGTNKTRWAQVAGSNFGNVQGEAGTYTYSFDVKIEETTESNLAMGNGTLPNVVSVDPFSAKVGEWDTVVVQTTLDSAGNIPNGTWSNFNFSANDTTKLSFDNAKIYFRPNTASVDVRANGEVVKKLTNVSTVTGVQVASLLETKVPGYDVVGVNFGGKVYTEGAIIVPCDAWVDLVLEVQDINPAAPTTEVGYGLRADNVVHGLRFKASIDKAETAEATAYGWIVTTEAKLKEAEATALELTLDSNIQKVVGFNYGENLPDARIFDENDTTAWFTAVLYFGETEADGLPSAEKLAGRLVARPFVQIDGETIYGEPTAPKSIFEVALDYYYEYNLNDSWIGIGAEVGAYCDAVLEKVDFNADDIPDIWQ